MGLKTVLKMKKKSWELKPHPFLILVVLAGDFNDRNQHHIIIAQGN
jgi:hypothetical protein